MDYKLKRIDHDTKAGDIQVKFSDGKTDSFNKHGIFVSTRPRNITRIKQRTDHTFKGRNGFLSIDHSTWLGDELEFDFSFLSKDDETTFDQMVFLNDLQNETELTFIFYHEPFNYFKGYVVSISELQGSKILGKNKTAKITFKLQPERYFNHQHDSIVLNKGDRIQVDYGVLDGIFELKGSGDITLTVGSSETVLKNISDQYPVLIDSYLKRTYANPTKNTYKSLSHYKYDGRYPIFNKYSTTINWTGNISQLKLMPNWRL